MADANQRPTRADEEQRKRRKERGATVQAGVKLTVDETKLDPNFKHRWVKDHGGRMSQLQGEEWRPAPEDAVIGNQGAGTVGTKIGGTDESGKPYSMVLMRKWKPWFEADQKEKQAPLDEMDKAIRYGTNHTSETGSDPDFYTPNGQNQIDTRSTR